LRSADWFVTEEISLILSQVAFMYWLDIDISSHVLAWSTLRIKHENFDYVRYTE